LTILAGNFNGLSNDDIISGTTLLSIVNQPTRGPNCLDRIFTNELCYAGIKVLTSTAKSDHKAVVAYTGSKPKNINKRREKRRFRKRSPSQLAAFLKYVSQLEFEVSGDLDVQTNFNNFYDTLNALLDQCFPEREITVTSADPHFITPAIKSMLRRKNRLMRAGRTDEAGALAKRV